MTRPTFRSATLLSYKFSSFRTLNASSWNTWRKTEHRKLDTNQKCDGISIEKCQLNEEQTKNCITILSNYCTIDRVERFKSVLLQRNYTSFIFENPSNPDNVWAALRTLDAFGVQNVHFCFPEAKRIKHGIGCALGTHNWLSISVEENIINCITKLKSNGYSIIATDLNCKSLSLYNFKSNIDPQSKKLFAFVFGNENTGISQTTRELTDHTVYIPMKGFAQSLNLNASVGVLCSYLQSNGFFNNMLSKQDQDILLLNWLLKTVPGGPRILERNLLK